MNQSNRSPSPDPNKLSGTSNTGYSAILGMKRKFSESLSGIFTPKPRKTGDSQTAGTQQVCVVRSCLRVILNLEIASHTYLPRRTAKGYSKARNRTCQSDSRQKHRRHFSFKIAKRATYCKYSLISMKLHRNYLKPSTETSASHWL
jgi:hypothetical protein